jgi:hypothetical protein
MRDKQTTENNNVRFVSSKHDDDDWFLSEHNRSVWVAEELHSQVYGCVTSNSRTPITFTYLENHNITADLITISCSSPCCHVRIQYIRSYGVLFFCSFLWRRGANNRSCAACTSYMWRTKRDKLLRAFLEDGENVTSQRNKA